MLDCLLRYIQYARLSNEIKYPDMEITAALIGAIQVMVVSDPMTVATSPKKQKMMRDTFERNSNRGAQTLWSIGRELLDLTNKVFEKAFADRLLRMKASQEKKQRTISFLRSNALLSFWPGCHGPNSVSVLHWYCFASRPDLLRDFPSPL